MGTIAGILFLVLQSLAAGVTGESRTEFRPDVNLRKGSASHTCSKWQVEISPQKRGHEPWTHAPNCLPSNGKVHRLCVYTDAEFNNGQGLSIVAAPHVVEKMVEQDLLRYEGVTKSPAIKYEAIEKPGLGIGLYVKASEDYKAGEIIMREYPTLIFPSGSVDSISSEALDMLRWRALLQLPDTARQRTRALARSIKVHKDEIVDILDTNAFTHQKGGGTHDIIFPEAAVS